MDDFESIRKKWILSQPLGNSADERGGDDTCVYMIPTAHGYLTLNSGIGSGLSPEWKAAGQAEHWAALARLKRLLRDTVRNRR